MTIRRQITLSLKKPGYFLKNTNPGDFTNTRESERAEIKFEGECLVTFQVILLRALPYTLL